MPRSLRKEELKVYLLTDPMRVTMVSIVVTPNPTLAGAAPLSR